MKNYIKRIYEGGIKFLLLPFFKWVYLILSHGLFHIFLLIIVGGLALHFYYNNQDKLKDTVAHTIIIKTKALERFADENGNKNILSMKHYHLNIILNSDSTSKKTNGKYRDCVRLWIMPPSIEKDSIILPACEDTLLINMIRIPGDSPLMIEESVNDSLPGNKDFPKAKILKDSAGISSVCTVLNNEAIIPESNHQYAKGKKITFYSNDFGIGKSPYYYYNFIFETPDSFTNKQSLYNGNMQYSFSIELDDSRNHDDDFNFFSKKQIIYHKIEPKPDYISAGTIIYNSEESLEAVSKNGGVFLFAEDLEISNKNKQEEFLNSVLTGTCIAFMLDIIVQLVLKLRRLHQNRKKKRE